MKLLSQDGRRSAQVDRGVVHIIEKYNKFEIVAETNDFQLVVLARYSTLKEAKTVLRIMNNTKTKHFVFPEEGK